ncbi:activating signal cointegrator 1 complex subunit 3-like [Diadema antillarum]|uniref:activating signal cointegrator 1 complex subunit 3-like n=1 Tax=Diadema antillarum TaxID=105358 RepID=UPI003A8757D2
MSFSDVEDVIVSDDDCASFSSDVDEDVLSDTKSTYRRAGDGQESAAADGYGDDDDVVEESPNVEERMGGDDEEEVEFDLRYFSDKRSGDAFKSRRDRKTHSHIYDSMVDGTFSELFVGSEIIKLPSDCRHRNEPTYEEVVIPPPNYTTTAAEQELMPIAELDEVSRKAFRGMQTLNLIQTIVFDAAYNTDENLLICAPTGAGKTNIAMLAVLHEVRKHIQQGVVKIDEFKIVYVAPMKALAAEMVETFGSRLKPLGITVKELTGDSKLTKKEIMQSQMLVVTPEKWDVITRKSTGDATLIQLVKLLIIDEVHLLHEDRGAVIECLVARTLRQVEAYETNVRIVGLSATLPNYKDVAKFLHVNLDKGLFFFDARFRPVPLQQSFIGVKNLHFKKIKEKDLMNDVCYEKMKEVLENGHQVLVFVFSRNGTRETADELLRRLARESTPLFCTEKHELFEDAEKELERLHDKILADLVPQGFAVHHAGISRPGRNFVEKYFAAGLIRVLCCTTTLAWGVNLPAHAVIIKGTKFYNPDTSRFEDVGILDVLQIFGRAGRPQFDTFGEGYIITSHSKLPHYLKLLMTQNPIESQFKEKLADNLNAEIVLGTVSNTEEALRWLRYTYLYIRMRLNPKAYGLRQAEVMVNHMGYSFIIKICRLQHRCDYNIPRPPAGATCCSRLCITSWEAVVLDDRNFQNVLEKLVTTSARLLQRAKMVKTDVSSRSFEYTEIGRIASHLYVTWQTIQHFNEKIPICRDEEEIFPMISGAHEFKQVKVRKEEKDELETLDERYCEVYVSYAKPIESGTAKVNILLQAYISRVKPKAFSLVSDMNNVAQNAARLMRALFEMALDAERPHMADQVLKYAKAVDQRIWPKENPLSQFHSWECHHVIASAPHITAEDLKKMDPLAIGDIVYNNNKKISKDEKRRCGLRVQDIARQLPFVSLDVSLQPLDHYTLRICVKVTPDFIWKDWNHVCGSEHWWIWVEDSSMDVLHHYEYFSITKRQVEAKEPQDLFFIVRLPCDRDVVYTVRAISEDWLGVEAEVSVRLDDFLLPSTNEFYSEPARNAITELLDSELEKLFDFHHFNAIQQSVFNQVNTNGSDGNVLLGAPSYSGKIVAAELAMLALFKTEPWSKVAYIAPVRALAVRRFTDWKSRFGEKLGKKVRILNGDCISDERSIQSADVIVTTAANWEAVSRTWETVRDVSLLILDGLQFLGDECGPMMETIVARAKRMSHHTGRVVRMVGLSTTMANAKDVARWLEVDDDHLFNFQSVHRPVKLELNVAEFSGKFYHIRTAAMNKPVFNAIKTTKKRVLVFVLSRKQATATAFELVAFLRHEENPQMWCRLKKEKVDDMAASVFNQNLQLALSYGIGVHHPGLSWSDRRTVEKLYRDKYLKVLVATKRLAWSTDLRARLVIVKGTEQYDVRTRRYVDMPVTDLLQMIGRAGRNKDSRGTALVMVQNTKRDFYKTALRDPVSLESRPNKALPEYVNAEVASGNIKVEQDFEDYMKTTFFYTKLTANPSYYGLPGTSEREMTKFMAEVIESTLVDLSDSECIRRHKDEDCSVSALPLGRIASQNHIHHDTVKMIKDRLKPDSSIGDILTIISNAVEFASMLVRFGEDNMNRTLSMKVRYPLSGPSADFTSPHTKTNLLLQAHIARLTLPCTEYDGDTKSVLGHTDRILKALVEIADLWKWYQTAMNVMYLTQSVVQAQWSSENSLLTLPHVKPTLLSSFINPCGKREIKNVQELISVCNGDKSALHAMLKGKLHQSQIEEMWNVIEKLPVVQVDLELRPRPHDGSLTGFPGICNLRKYIMFSMYT